ncbi:cupin domain-containing protein [Mucilaginibacter sp. HMF5004]|uniref:cupin domain-containing protein n=1 Tax=Mucilaginibacter rivuli TaxID=2857527 RepID=UPI001C60462C|nr:cupin domain-containing protein [Mucilaginibacter rivuli]MBW4889988.1 cupin domain-containing protein [Mucilaginibacter rivuli]
MNKDFEPNAVDFEFGVKRVNDAIKAWGKSLRSGIITSKDNGIQSLLDNLKVKNVPDNFMKWQLPFIFERSQLYVSVGNPNASVPEHSHDEGDGIRYIVSGSINYQGKVLNAGDWMFIPQGKKYSFEVGNLGATMFYCYQCCCVGRLD